MKTESDVISIFSRYRATLARYIRSIVKPQDIDDIVQETFVRSYEAELKHEIKYPRTFMLKTVRNLALNHVSRWDNKYATSMEDLPESPVPLVSASLEREFESKERFRMFCRAIDKLPAQCRKAFVLKKVYGLSQKEIAAYLKVSESTVEKHIAKGMLKCLEYMEAMGGEAATNAPSRSPRGRLKSGLK